MEGPGRHKKLTNKDCYEWVLTAVNHKGAPRDQVRHMLWMQLASYLEGGPLMWMMPLHLHVNQIFDYDYDDEQVNVYKFL